ncbi:hypothetical protein DPMN_106322 [Dreissena polymorpha]|uniref:Uncharacterized protein n=1 Tax=Dreissena polymorpha TaxID=45954 RepID=A0A9D4K4T4_DREPO|nr:hypothetical protein DPMN_106322 [Dreissena polymorpha]
MLNSVSFSLSGPVEGIEEINGKSVEHSYEKQGPKVVIYPIEGHNHAVVVHCDNSYSIVKIDFKGPKPVLKCSTCCKKRSASQAAFTLIPPYIKTLLCLMSHRRCYSNLI